MFASLGAGRSQGTCVQAVRIMRMLQALETGQEFTLEAFAKRFSITPRQVRRDLNCLEDGGYRVVRRLGPEGQTAYKRNQNKRFFSLE
jgi:predicted DNA-binding transcriptional regulator YafY